MTKSNALGAIMVGSFLKNKDKDQSANVTLGIFADKQVYTLHQSVFCHFSSSADIDCCT